MTDIEVLEKQNTEAWAIADSRLDEARQLYINLNLANKRIAFIERDLEEAQALAHRCGKAYEAEFLKNQALQVEIERLKK